MTMSELAADETPAVADAAREAARGKVVHITVHGERLAAIVPESALEALRAAEDAEDAAEADAAMDEPGDDIPLEQLEAEFGH
jgi:antitoxin (DNA-binding transcriptional repressor) of toxin-antitoxin stability system